MTEQREQYEIIEAEVVNLGTIRTAGPAAVIREASAIAEQLAEIVNSRQLYSTISGRKYVKVEGWTTLGAMLGVLPREVETHRIEDGWESTVELVRANDGQVIGRGSAICTREERNWAKRDDYAVRSMAITRATGKAYRLGFSWVMALAGYEPTPAEEMDGSEPQHRAPRPQRQAKELLRSEPAPESKGDNGWGAFWQMYHDEAKPEGIARKHAENIAAKYGEPEKAMQRLADYIAGQKE